MLRTQTDKPSHRKSILRTVREMVRRGWRHLDRSQHGRVVEARMSVVVPATVRVLPDFLDLERVFADDERTAGFIDQIYL